jgi:hypothetical protein
VFALEILNTIGKRPRRVIIELGTPVGDVSTPENKI